MIERITDSVFDTRFYHDPSKINPRTGNSFFPAYHFITSVGAPEPVGLSKWRQQNGMYADDILARSAEIGSFVHDSIDRMIKSNVDIQHADIDAAFPNEKEAYKIKVCLLAFMNFMSDQQPEILASERMSTGEDFGFTLDLEARILADDYKDRWVLDWKTSKVVSEEHKMQVESIRRVVGADKAGVIILGNTTKKKYTFTEVKDKERDYLWEKFCAVKETAYVELLRRGSIEPRKESMPDKFSIKDINIKRIFGDSN
jgi:hypothetical protein